MARRRIPSLLAVAASLSLALAGLTLADAAHAQPTSHRGTFAGTGFGAIPDGTSLTCPAPGAPRDVSFSVAGVSTPLTDVRVTGLTLNPPHGFAGDLQVTLIAPNGATHVLFSRTGATSASGFGDSSDLAGPYTFADDATGNWWSAALAAGTSASIPAGSYRTSQAGGLGATGAVTNMTAAFAGVTNPNGTWTLRFVDGCQGDTGTVTAANLVLHGASDCLTQQAAVTSATATATAADQGVATSQAAVAKATKSVKKAKKALKAATKSGNHAKIAKAKKKLKKAKKALKQARTAETAAEQKAAAAHQQLNAARAALTTCQTT